MNFTAPKWRMIHWYALLWPLEVAISLSYTVSHRLLKCGNFLSGLALFLLRRIDPVTVEWRTQELLRMVEQEKASKDLTE